MTLDARKQVVTPARMVPKFVNGVITVFDTVFFDHGPALDTFKEARDTAARMNATMALQGRKGHGLK